MLIKCSFFSTHTLKLIVSYANKKTLFLSEEQLNCQCFEEAVHLKGNTRFFIFSSGTIRGHLRGSSHAKGALQYFRV